MKFNITCPRCGGTGKAERCAQCATAKGRLSVTRTIEVRIKPGTRDGQRIRLAGNGNAGTMGRLRAISTSSFARASIR